MYLRSFSVKGYRSFLDTVTLANLGPVVVFYGLNNAGKTNLIRAIDLFHRLIDLDLHRLLDPASRNADALYAELGQDPWMFHMPGGDIVELSGGVATSCDGSVTRIGFRLARNENGVSIALTEWCDAGAYKWLERAKGAWLEWRRIQDLTPPGNETSDEAQQSFQREIDLADQHWQEASEAWTKNTQAHKPGVTTHLAINDVSTTLELRNRFAQLTRSVDLKRRNRSQWALDCFAKAVPSLPVGRLEAIDVPSTSVAEVVRNSGFGWISKESVLPLDQLGSGAQAIFAVLSALAVAETRVVALEEPESSLNAQIQRVLADAIIGSIGAEVPVVQLFIATHSPAFARHDCDIWLVDRRDGNTEITQEMAADIARLTGFPEPSDDSKRERTASLLDFDGSVRLPDYVLKEFESSKGHFVYFVPAAPSGFRIVASDEMAKLLGEDES